MYISHKLPLFTLQMIYTVIRFQGQLRLHQVHLMYVYSHFQCNLSIMMAYCMSDCTFRVAQIIPDFIQCFKGLYFELAVSQIRT